MAFRATPRNYAFDWLVLLPGKTHLLFCVHKVILSAPEGERRPKRFRQAVMRITDATSLLAHTFNVKVHSLRSVAAIALSCWFGLLACILGCAQPVSAAVPYEQGPISGAAPGSHTHGCCNHTPRPAGGPGENRQSGVSCCSFDATLIQKQDTVPPLRDGTHQTALASLTLFSPDPASVTSEICLSTIWHAGRDILLRSRVLRI